MPLLLIQMNTKKQAASRLSFELYHQIGHIMLMIYLFVFVYIYIYLYCLQLLTLQSSVKCRLMFIVCLDLLMSFDPKYDIMQMFSNVLSIIDRDQ